MRFSFWLAVSVAFAAQGCANTTPSLPIRKIDQPYTLPEDTREFAIGAGFQYTKERGRNIDREIVPTEGNLSFPLSDTWTYDFLTHFRHQLHHDEQDTLGFGFGFSEIGYTSYDGFFMAPALSVYYRRNISRSFALETQLRGIYRYYSENPARPWLLALRIAPLFQLDDTKYLRFTFDISKERLFYQMRDLYQDYRVLASTARSRVVLPVGADFGWRFDVQWEARVNYDYYGIGYGGGYHSHVLGLGLSRYW